MGWGGEAGGGGRLSRSAVGQHVQRPWPGKEPGTEKEQTAKGPGAAGGRGWTNREEAGRRRPGKDLAFIPNALEKPL